MAGMDTTRRTIARRPTSDMGKPEVAALWRDVCIAPVSGHRQAVSACPKSAITGLLIHDFPVRVLADHLAIAERIEVTTLDLL